MSEDEKNMAYAVLATQGRDAAAKYLENYRSTAVSEKAAKDFKEFQASDPNAFDYAVKALKGGFNRAMAVSYTHLFFGRRDRKRILIGYYRFDYRQH